MDRPYGTRFAILEGPIMRLTRILPIVVPCLCSIAVAVEWDIDNGSFDSDLAGWDVVGPAQWHSGQARLSENTQLGLTSLVQGFELLSSALELSFDLAYQSQPDDTSGGLFDDTLQASLLSSAGEPLHQFNFAIDDGASPDLVEWDLEPLTDTDDVALRFDFVTADDGRSSEVLLDNVTLTYMMVTLSAQWVLGDSQGDPETAEAPLGLIATIGVPTPPVDDAMFVGWEGDVDAGHEKDNPLELLMDRDKSIRARFELPRVTLTLETLLGDGQGAAPQTWTYELGIVARLPVPPPPSDGAVFVGWAGDVPEGHGPDDPLALTMDRDRSVVARFESPSPPGCCCGAAPLALTGLLLAFIGLVFPPRGPGRRAVARRRLEVRVIGGLTFAALTVAQLEAAPQWDRMIDVSDTVQVDLSVASVKAASQELALAAKLTHNAALPLVTPVVLVFDSLETPGVTLATKDGTTPDGRPYVELMGRADGPILMRGESTQPRVLTFQTTGNYRFRGVVRALAFNDTVAPTVAIKRPGHGSLLETATPSVKIQFADADAGVDPNSVSVKVNGVESVGALNVKPDGASGQLDRPLAGGPCRIEVSLCDRVGNESKAHADFRVSVFQAVPQAYPTSGPPPLEVKFYTRAIDTDGTVEMYEWDFDGDGEFDASVEVAQDYTHTYTDLKTYHPKLRITDNLGRSTETVLDIEVGASPPQALARATPSNGPVPLTVQFSGHGTSRGSSIVKHEWDLDGDGVYDEEVRFEPNDPNYLESSPEFTYEQAATVNVKFRVTDAEGQTAEADRILTAVRAGEPNSPSIQANAWPETGDAPLTVNLDGGDLAGTAVTYEWDFEGDGTFDWSSEDSEDGWGPDPSVTHTYEQAGVYYPALRMTDSEGRSCYDQLKIVVTVAASLGLSANSIDVAAAETVDIRTALSGGSKVWLFVRDDFGKEVRRILDGVVREGRPWSYWWDPFADPNCYYVDVFDGKGADGQTLPEGKYYVVLEYESAGAREQLDTTWTTGGSRDTPTRDPLPSQMNVLANELPAIGYTLDTATEVTSFIGFYSLSKRFVTLMERVPQPPGTYAIRWDGLDPNTGELAEPPPGDMFLAGLFSYTLPDNCILVHGGLKLSEVSVQPTVFDPSQAVFDQSSGVTVQYSVTRPCDVVVDVVGVGEGRNWVYRSITKRNQPAGKGVVVWDGRNDTGVFVGPGDYRVRVKAIGANGDATPVWPNQVRVRY